MPFGGMGRCRAREQLDDVLSASGSGAWELVPQRQTSEDAKFSIGDCTIAAIATVAWRTFA
jgi:hypothetical protein